MVDIAANLQSVRGRVAAAATRAGVDPASITLLAVTKTIPVEAVEAAVRAGARALGESRVQEAEEKIPLVTGEAAWHFIGPLQSNKARLAALLFDVIQSVDRPGLADRLADAAGRRRRPLAVWAQVDTKSEATEDERFDVAAGICRRIVQADALRLQGLMTIPPYDPDPEAARPWFRQLRSIRDRLQAQGDLPPLGLSMGMSGDFEVAIEEGSTLVRVGTAIFGERPAAASA